MANKKFSEFTVKTDPANVDFLVGYDGTDNVRIDPSNLGGGGASDLNGLSDVSIDLTNDNAFFINIPSGVSGAVGNIGLGEEALNSLTSGDYNTAIGKQALNNSTTSERSTAIGYNAGASAGTNLQLNAVLIGDNAGFGRSGYRTVAVGSGAMSFGLGKSAVNRNTAIGYHALYRIDTNGADNIAIGHEASQFLTTATKNIAIGDNAARSSTANGHISIGYQAGYSQTSGATNTNIGFFAGYNTTTGGDNTYVGYQTAYSATGSRNTAMGDGAFGGGFGHSGSDNASFGYLALQSPSGASNYNVAMGSEALREIGTKSNNVGIGYKAGTALATGEGNTFVGYQAGLNANPSGGSSGQNTCIGNTSGGAITTGIYNTFLGSKSGNAGGGSSATITTGNFNTMLGYEARGNSTAIANSTSIGYGSQSTGSNQVTLGNSSISTLRCAVTSITSLSDERDKSEIKDLEYGLAFIDALQPREFVWDNRPETDGDGEEFYSANKGKKDFGFIAQEVRELDNDTLRLVYSENEDKLELSYGKLVPILVKAIQELKEEVELLKSQNN